MPLKLYLPPNVFLAKPFTQPQTLLILKGGKEVDRIFGVQSREAILQRLKTFL